jgi:hypothetical protein
VPPGRRPASPRPPPTSGHGPDPRENHARTIKVTGKENGAPRPFPDRGETPTAHFPRTPFPGPKAAPLPGKSSPQEWRAHAHSPQRPAISAAPGPRRRADARGATGQAPRALPIHQGKQPAPPGGPGQQPFGNRPAAPRVPDSGRFAVPGTVHPSQHPKPPLTWGGWLAGLRSMSTDPTPSKSKRVGSANTPLQPASHPKSRSRSKSKQKIKIRVETITGTEAAKSARLNQQRRRRQQNGTGETGAGKEETASRVCKNTGPDEPAAPRQADPAPATFGTRPRLPGQRRNRAAPDTVPRGTHAPLGRRTNPGQQRHSSDTGTNARPIHRPHPKGGRPAQGHP